MEYLYAYLAAISLLAIILTLRDKRAARKGQWRIKENTLLLVSVLGGSVAMLLIMRLIRHKTLHKKFMIGIPLIIILQITAVFFIWWRLTGSTF